MYLSCVLLELGLQMVECWELNLSPVVSTTTAQAPLAPRISVFIELFGQLHSVVVFEFGEEPYRRYPGYGEFKVNLCRGLSMLGDLRLHMARVMV